MLTEQARPSGVKHNGFIKSLRIPFEGEKNVLKGRIESLETMVKLQTTQIEELSRKHEQAYEKVQDIANRAVAAAKREIVSVPYRLGSTGDDGKQTG